MEYNTDSNAEVVLGAVKDTSRIVIKLDNTNINSVTGPNVDAAPKCRRKAGITLGKIAR
jgi:hypothetical protein